VASAARPLGASCQRIANEKSASGVSVYERAGIVARIVEGIDFSGAAEAVDLIHEVGPLPGNIESRLPKDMDDELTRILAAVEKEKSLAE
jgi:hypothetical protein